jgi:alpha/beta hydrolase family protein
MRFLQRSASLLLVLLGLVSLLEARVVRVDIASREDVLGGQPFGDGGAYERITGRVYFSVAVANKHNRGIVDLENAVNLKDGEVEFWSDFLLVRPKEAAHGNGTLLLEVPNRGHPRILSVVDGGSEDLSKDAGDGWFLRHGYTVAALGWQWDAAGDDALRLYTPVAKDHGHTISGLLRGDVMPAKPMQDLPLGHLMGSNIGGTEYPAAAPDDPRNVLTVRDSPLAPHTVIARSQWSFGHLVDGKVEPSDRYIHLQGGFQPGKIYEYIYVVKDPVVAGLGFAAVRDFASYVKHNPDAIAPAARVVGEGISQNGRYLRDFLYQGFNTDEQGRMALDGVLAHVAGAGRGNFNYRFCQPSRDAQPTSSLLFPTDIFPFTDEPEIDPLTRASGGLLDRVRAEHTLPKIFFSNTSYEYWGRVASLIHTTADGKRDMPISDQVRIYHFTGLQHYSGPFPPARGEGDRLGQEPQSPLAIRYFWRAMFANMDAWIRTNTPPPPSSYPRITDGTLVSLTNYAFPEIPGINKPHETLVAYRLDLGPGWPDAITIQPPIAGKAFPVLVPQVNEDGNERDGVRSPELVVPLATYTGWNLRDPSIAAPEQRVSFEGSYIQFAKTADERKKSGDPRKSIVERYTDREEYLKLYGAAVNELIQQKYVLSEDRDALLKRGQQEWDLATQ